MQGMGTENENEMWYSGENVCGDTQQDTMQFYPQYTPVQNSSQVQNSFLPQSYSQVQQPEQTMQV